MSTPKVDIVIATIGRKSLEQAILAACSQSYHKCRVVVIGDGPCPDAKATVKWLKQRYKKKLIYRETKTRLGGYGDYVKRWWIDNKEASEYIRFLDDDDWIPPNAIRGMMELWTPETTVILCAMLLVFSNSQHTDGKGYWQMRKPALQHRQACSGMALFKTEAARNTNFPDTKFADSSLALDCAKQGEAQITDTPLYWYNAHQGGKVHSTETKQGQPYNPAWRYKPPRSFRKSLFNRVPLANYYNDDKPWLVYDQALFRPMGAIARKVSWIRTKTYYYDVPDENTKTVDIHAIRDHADMIMQRGYISEGQIPKSVGATTGANIVFVTPAYKAAGSIHRTIESIFKQRGAWEAIITVDGYDAETYNRAKQIVDNDPRFTIVMQDERKYALGNILEVMPMIPDNKIVCFVDADDYLIVDDLVLTLERLYADDDVEIVCGTTVAMLMSTKQKKQRFCSIQNKLKQIMCKINKQDDIVKCCALAESAGRATETAIDIMQKANAKGVGNERAGRYIAKLIELRKRLLNNSKRSAQIKTIGAISKTIKQIEG